MVMVSYLVHYDALLHNATDIITKCVRFFITKCDSFITNCDSFYKMRRFYYKIQRLLQNASVHFSLAKTEKGEIMKYQKYRSMSLEISSRTS